MVAASIFMFPRSLILINAVTRSLLEPLNATMEEGVILSLT